MANNILGSGALNFRVCVASQPVRLIGTVQSGEIDGTTVITSANTRSIFYYTTAGALQTFTPGNAFSPYKVMNPGDAVAIVGKTAYELPHVFPLPDATQQAAALSAVQSILGSSPNPGPSPNPPTGVTGTIAITVPAAAATVTAGNITVSGTYTVTAGTLTGIQARWNGGTWATLQSNPSGGTYTGTLAVAAGTGNVEVRFTDNTAVTASRSITVTASSPTPAPTGTIAFTAPADNATVDAGSVTLSGTYTVASGTLTAIEWRFNGGTWATLATNPTGGTFSQAVSITTAATGAIEVRFANNTAVTASRTITVSAPSVTGTIALSAPAQFATVTAGTISVNGQYTVASGTLTGVEWRYNNGTWATLTTTQSNGFFTGNVSITTPATNAPIEVRFANNTAVTASRTITVLATSTVPTYTYNAGSYTVDTTAGTIRESARLIYHGSNRELLSNTNPQLRRFNNGSTGTGYFTFPTVNSTQEATAYTVEDWIEFAASNNQLAGTYENFTILFAGSSKQGGFLLNVERAANTFALSLAGLIGDSETVGNLNLTFNTGGTDRSLFASGAITRDTLGVYLIRKDANRIRIRANGTQVLDNTDALNAGSIVPTGVVRIGRNQTFGSGSMNKTRTFQFWGRSLSDAEVTTIESNFYAGITGTLPSVTVS